MARRDRPTSSSRRKFLKGVGGAAAAAVALPKLRGTLLAAPQVLEQAPGAATLKRVSVRLKVNGSVYPLQVEPRWTLLDVLRNHLNLTGAKKACDRAECGACTVLLEGKLVYACMMLAIDAAEREITTIEGLAHGGRLHPVQEAFLRNDALQCGFCTPGMILAVKSLLDRNPNPSPEEIRHGISGNLCKCGTYTKIFRAAREAGEMIRSGQAGRQVSARSARRSAGSLSS